MWKAKGEHFCSNFLWQVKVSAGGQGLKVPWTPCCNQTLVFTFPAMICAASAGSWKQNALKQQINQALVLNVGFEFMSKF